DDAKVLPKGVLRTYLAPSVSFGSQEFNEDGEKDDTDSATFINLGAAFEYGVNDWISAAVQWGPGYNVYSTFEDAEDQTANGPFEAFVGAKVQVLGEMAPAKSDKFRVAFAPGVMVPLAFGYDAEEEAANAVAGDGDEYNVLPANNVFGIGGRFYADYVVNKQIFLNVYSQYKYFFPKAGEDDFTQQYTKKQTESLGGSYTLPDEIDYGYELTLEFEPHYATMIADGVELSAGLPITYVITPETEIDGTGQDDATKSLDITGNVSAFFQKLPLPMEVQVGYTYPVWGEKTAAINTLVTQLKFYAKF
ncbi:MAG: hypothetical protein ACOCZA_06955, partial [Spirochaetota bacterium]